MKRKVLISVLILALTLSLCLGLLVACNPDEQTTGSYTVTFSLGEYEGADPPAAMQADSNGKIVLPSAPQWAEHDFLGWQADGSSEYLQPGTEYTVPSNITLVAKWIESASTPQTHTVTLKDGDDVDTFEVSEGAALGANLPATGSLQDAHKQFNGWYLADEQGSATSEKVTSEYKPASDVTLIAVYDEVWLVTLQDEGESEDVVLKVVKGQEIGSQLPAAGAITDDAHKEFAGWYIGGGVNKIEGTYTPTQDITLTARYNTYYLVTVKIDGQAEAAPRKVLVAEPKNSLQLQASEELDHRIFKGWYKEGEDTALGTSATLSYTPNGDVTLEARYNDLYTLTFKDCDEEDGQKKDRIVKLERGVALGTLLPTATFDPNRFEFVGWYVADGNGAPTEAQVTAAFTTEADVTIVAKFNNKYAIEFYDGGALVKTLYFVSGTVLGDSDKAQFPNTTPAADKQFDGWYLMDGDDQTDNPFDATKKITSDVKVYAKYSNNYWLLTFVDGDKQTEVKVTKGQTLGTQLPQDPTPAEGKYFNGWFVANEHGAASETKVDNTFKPEKDLKIVADYKDMYKVTLKGATVEYVYVKPGDALPELTPKASETDAGKVFEGWYIMKGAAPADDDKKIEKANEYKPTGNVTIYAKFVEPAVENYTVHFKNGDDVTDVEVPTNAAIGEKLPAAPADTDETYFAGWFLANDASYVATDAQITSSYKPADGVKEVYAVAVFKQFLKVTLKDGQSSKIVKVKQGASVPAADLAPATPADCSFDGWFVSEDGTTPTETKFDDKTVVDHDMTVIAKYTLAVWYVTFKGECIKDGDADGTQKVVKVQKGTKLGTLPEIEESKLNHKRFDKWVIENTDTTVTTEYQPEGDVTVVAKYVDTVTITFVYGPNNMPITIDKDVAIGSEKLAAPQDYKPEHVGEFLGWYRDGGEGAKVEPTDVFSADITLTAKYAYLIADDYLGDWNCEIYNEDGTIMYMLRIFAEGETIEDSRYDQGNSIYLIWVANRLEYEKWDNADPTKNYQSWNISKIEAAENGGYNLLSPSGAISATIKLENGAITYKSNDGISNLDLTLTKVKDEYEITFDDDGRTTSRTVTNGQAIGESFPAPQRKEGCDFVGWFIKDTNISVGMNYIPISDLTIVAKYEERNPVSSIAAQYHGAYFVGNHPYKGKSADLYLVIDSYSIMLAIQQGAVLELNYETDKYEHNTKIEYIFVETSKEEISGTSIGYTFGSYSIRFNQGKLQLIDSVGTVADLESRYYIVQWLDEDDSNYFFSTIDKDNHKLESTGLVGQEDYMPQRYGVAYRGACLVQNGVVTNYNADKDTKFTKSADKFDDAAFTIDSDLIVYKMVWRKLGDNIESIDASYVGDWEYKTSYSDRKIQIAANGNIKLIDNNKGTTLHASLSDIWPYNGQFLYTYKQAHSGTGYVVAFRNDDEEFDLYYVIEIYSGVFRTITTSAMSPTATTYEKVVPPVDSIDADYIGSYTSLTAAKTMNYNTVTITDSKVVISIVKNAGVATEYTFELAKIFGTKQAYTLGDSEWMISLGGSTLTLTDLTSKVLSESSSLTKLAAETNYIYLTYSDGDAILGYAIIEAGGTATVDEVKNDSYNKIANGWKSGDQPVNGETVFIVDAEASENQIKVEAGEDGKYSATISRDYIELTAVESLDESYDASWKNDAGDILYITAASASIQYKGATVAGVFENLSEQDGYIFSVADGDVYKFYVIKVADTQLSLTAYGEEEESLFTAEAKPAEKMDEGYYGAWKPATGDTIMLIIEDDENGHTKATLIFRSSSRKEENVYEYPQILGNADEGYQFGGNSIKLDSSGKISNATTIYGSKTFEHLDYVVKALNEDGSVKDYYYVSSGRSLGSTAIPSLTQQKGKMANWYLLDEHGDYTDTVITSNSIPVKSGDVSGNQVLIEGVWIIVKAKYSDPGEVVSEIDDQFVGYWEGDNHLASPGYSSKALYHLYIDKDGITIDKYTSFSQSDNSAPFVVSPTASATRNEVTIDSIWKIENGYRIDKSTPTATSSSYVTITLVEGKLIYHDDTSAYDATLELANEKLPSEQVTAIDEQFIGVWNSYSSPLLIVKSDSIFIAIKSGTTYIEGEYSLDDIKGNATDGYYFGKHNQYRLFLNNGKPYIHYTSSSGSLSKAAYLVKYLDKNGVTLSYDYIANEGDALGKNYSSQIKNTLSDVDLSSFVGWYLVKGGELTTQLTESSIPVKTAEAATGSKFLAEDSLITIRAKFELSEGLTAAETIEAKYRGTWQGNNSHYASANEGQKRTYLLTIEANKITIAEYIRMWDIGEDVSANETWEATIFATTERGYMVAAYQNGKYDTRFELYFDEAGKLIVYDVSEKGNFDIVYGACDKTGLSFSDVAGEYGDGVMLNPGTITLNDDGTCSFTEGWNGDPVYGTYKFDGEDENGDLQITIEIDADCAGTYAYKDAEGKVTLKGKITYTKA